MKLGYIHDTLMLMNEMNPFLSAGVVLKGADRAEWAITSCEQPQIMWWFHRSSRLILSLNRDIPPPVLRWCKAEDR